MAAVCVCVCVCVWIVIRKWLIEFNNFYINDTKINTLLSADQVIIENNEG
jgi:hypothetical protein